MFSKHKDTIIKVVLIGMGLLTFRFLSFLLSPHITDSPVYSLLYVVINVLLVVAILQVYGIYEEYNRKAVIKWQTIKLTQIELSLEHLKAVMFENLDLSDEEIKEYAEQEKKIQSATKSYVRKL